MRLFPLFFLTALYSHNLHSQSPLTKMAILVDGNCKMCKKTIEKACNTDGVKKAIWNVKTHLLELEFNQAKITLDQIQLRIASSGYDTPIYKANIEKYNSLHTCCQYRK